MNLKPLFKTAKTSGQLQSFAVQVGDFVEAGKVIAYINPVVTSENTALRRNSDFEAHALLRERQIKQQQQALLIGKLVSEVSLLLQTEALAPHPN